jgi:hypothetical protein
MGKTELRARQQPLEQNYIGFRNDIQVMIFNFDFVKPDLCEIADHHNG